MVLLRADNRVHAAVAVERADRAVCQAKQSGRNLVRCHEALLECGALQASEKVGAIELF